MRTDRTSTGAGLVSPFSMVDELRRAMERLADDGLSELGTAFEAGPPLTVAEEGDRLIVRADVPGVPEDAIDVRWEGETLTIQARREIQSPEGWTVRRAGRPSFELARAIRLPATVDVDAASATVRNGVLEISFPKQAAAQPRRLTVRSSAAN